jgi:hypothetical protein
VVTRERGKQGEARMGTGQSVGIMCHSDRRNQCCFAVAQRCEYN